MSQPKVNQSTPEDLALIKKLKLMVATLQRSQQHTELQSRRLAQEIRELKSENAILKEKVRRHV